MWRGDFNIEKKTWGFISPWLTPRHGEPVGQLGDGVAGLRLFRHEPPWVKFALKVRRVFRVSDSARVCGGLVLFY